MTFLAKTSSLIGIIWAVSAPHLFSQSRIVLPLNKTEVERMLHDSVFLTNNSTVTYNLDSEHDLIIVRQSDGSINQGLSYLNQLEGSQYSFYGSGQVKEIIQYHQNCADGFCIKWHANGRIQEYGHMACLSNDTLITDTLYRYDELTGDRIVFISRRSELSVKDGLWFYYDETGDLAYVQSWFRGELKSEDYFDKN